MMYWRVSNRADPRAAALADRHYNRQHFGSPQFVPPGRCLVLLGEDRQAVWVTSWPFARYVKHKWAGAWVNSLFRREGGPLASELIREAIAATRFYWGEPPSLGLVSFIDESKIAPKGHYRKSDPGACYRKAGFTILEERTVGGLVVAQMLPSTMPDPEPAEAAQFRLGLV